MVLGTEGVLRKQNKTKYPLMGVCQRNQLEELQTRTLDIISTVVLKTQSIKQFPMSP